MTEDEEFEFRLRMEQEQAGNRGSGASGSWGGGASGTYKVDKPSGFKRGLVDDTTNAITQAMLGLTGWMDQEGAEKIKQYIQQGEDKYQQERGGTGFDWARLGGQMLNPVNLGIAALTKTPPGASMPVRLGAGAGAGGAMGAASPVYGDASRLENTLYGAGGGVAAVPLTSALGRIVSPKVSEQVKLLRKEGITPTVGQSFGGAVQRVEDKAMSFPIMGDAITSARKTGMDQFNRAAYNRALNPIGQKAGQDVGFEGVQKVHRALNKAYEDLLPKIGFKSDQQFVTDTSNLRQMLANASGIEPKDVQLYDAIVKRVMNMGTNQGLMNGRMFKKAEEVLGREIVKLNKDQSYGKQTVKEFLQQFRDTFRQGLERSNPMYQDQLRKINEGWANYAIIRKAASGPQAAQTGTFTPSQLMQGVQESAKRSGQAAGRGKLSEGKALMQDLANAGYDVLPSKYPDSGTAGRLMQNVLLNPVVGIPQAIAGATLGAAGSVPYLPGVRTGLDMLMNARPKNAELLAQLLRRNSAIASPALPALVNGVNNGE